MTQYRLVFFGTPAFVIPVLEALLVGTQNSSQFWTFAAVVTAPDKPVGRGLALQSSPVKLWAEEHKIPILQPEKLSEGGFVVQLKEINPTIGVIAAYGKIIPSSVLELFPKKVLNVHPSLLPHWRGPSPIQSAIAAGDSQTGVTLMLTTEKMDEGPIVAQSTYSLSGQETAVELQGILFRMGANLLEDALPRWLAGEIKPRNQEQGAATYSRLLKKENGRINWNQAGEVILRQLRAYHPWPGLFTVLPDGRRIKVISADFLPGTSLAPGMVDADSNRFCVAVLDGWLCLNTVQPEGKNRMSGEVFLKSRPEVKEQKL